MAFANMLGKEISGEVEIGLGRDHLQHFRLQHVIDACVDRVRHDLAPTGLLFNLITRPDRQ